MSKQTNRCLSSPLFGLFCHVIQVSKPLFIFHVGDKSEPHRGILEFSKETPTMTNFPSSHAIWHIKFYCGLVEHFINTKESPSSFPFEM